MRDCRNKDLYGFIIEAFNWRRFREIPLRTDMFINRIALFKIQVGGFAEMVDADTV